MVSIATPRRTTEPVPEPIQVNPVAGFLKEYVRDPFIAGIADQIDNAGYLPARALTLFTVMSAAIGKQLPGGFRVERETLSAEVAARNNLTVTGAHALMLRGLINNRGIAGSLARRILDADLGDATEFDLIDVRRVLPNGAFKTKVSRRLRELVRRKNRAARRGR